MAFSRWFWRKHLSRAGCLVLYPGWWHREEEEEAGIDLFLFWRFCCVGEIEDSELRRGFLGGNFWKRCERKGRIKKIYLFLPATYMSLRLLGLRGNSICRIDRGVVVMGRNRPSSDPFASNRRSPTLQRRRREQRVDDANVVAFRSNPFVATTKGASCRFGISAFPAGPHIPEFQPHSCLDAVSILRNLWSLSPV